MGTQGWDLGFKAGIGTSRLGFESHGWGLGLKAGIWASRLRFGPQGGGTKEKWEEEKEKFLHK